MKSVLILDDNAASRQTMAKQLTAEGYVVIESNDGVEALRLVANDCPDAILAEVWMPRMDGFAFCHQIKTDPALASIPLVLLTRHPPTCEDEAFAYSVGAEHFLLKPIARETLVAVVGRLVLRSKVLPLAVQNEAEYLRGYVARLRKQIREHTGEIQRALWQAEDTNSEVARARANWLSSEREELTNQMRRARRRLTELESKTMVPEQHLKFNADVSNDLQGILTMIMRSSDLLLSGAKGSLPEPQAERLLIIREGSRRVLDVLNALTTFERPTNLVGVGPAAE